MKTDYRFWEQNVNPITMQRDDKKNYSSSWDLEENGISLKEKRELFRKDKLLERKLKGLMLKLKK